MKFLQKEGFVDEAGALTDDGHWASRLRLDYPLLVAQCLRENAFPEENEKLLAAVVAFFAYDRDDDMKLTVKDLPPKLTLSFKKVALAVRPLIHRLEDGRISGSETSCICRRRRLLLGAGAQLGFCHQGHGNRGRRYGDADFAHSG